MARIKKKIKASKTAARKEHPLASRAMRIQKSPPIYLCIEKKGLFIPALAGVFPHDIFLEVAVFVMGIMELKFDQVSY